jgi:hypothetical protein
VRTPELLEIAILLACGVSVQAETLSGAVVDPQQFVVAGATVSLVCGGDIDTHTTDVDGNFAFTRQAFPENCVLRAVYSGFAPLELPVGTRRSFTLRLRIAEIPQSVSVTTDRLSLASLESVSLSDNELRNISNDSEDLLAYARQLAGIDSGSNQIYVDGTPADRPPPADRIENVTINADPFSAEYSDAGSAHIEITTKRPDPKFRITALGISIGDKAPNGLNPSLSSRTNSAILGLIGPVPRTPLAFTSNMNYSANQAQEPIEAVVPSLPGSSIAAVDNAVSSDTNHLFGLGTDYSMKDALRVNASLYVMTEKHTNMNVGGITLPEAGESQSFSAQEFRTTYTKTGEHFLSRGGISADWFNSHSNANSGQLGVSVLGDFIAGGASIDQQNMQWSRWTFKDVLHLDQKGHIWSVGATVTLRGDEENIVPNPYGQIYFDNSADYVLSASTGANSGTEMITQGQGKAEYASNTAAPFLETELLRRPGLSVRGGIRADAQTGGGLHFSPRLSAVTSLHGFILKSGSGMFVTPWTNDIFLRLMENDGNHLRQSLMTGVSLSGAAAGAVLPESEIVASTRPNLTPARSWVSSISIEYPFRSLVPAVEYTWTDGTHLLGSQRLRSATDTWTDWLGSNRSLQKHQIHVRTLFRVRGQRITAHYEWIHSRDNTDGPFSFPAIQNDIRGEWAPSSGIAAHNITFVFSSTIGKVLPFSLVDSWHSPLPLNIISGLDPEGNGLFTDRDGLARNSGRGTSYNSMDLFANPRLAVPKLRVKPHQKTYLDFKVQALNLLGNKNYSTFEDVIGSPLFGQPLAAAPGRTFRLSVNLSR